MMTRATIDFSMRFTASVAISARLRGARWHVAVKLNQIGKQEESI
jgi:hypothetical protein